ncbi:conserved Plasmodium protein, unknown function [Plasmodium malariae]|uniref:Uncharacterized protein n=2 Tax=Plasmodium malariae TaxID=5858 RepID=A0A1D3SME1_PLAMA|nr:conserved Plasmodium protein, unknown function [Plasmodium malariae]SCO92938.1 conserved Plasmodium protein, unknown function [Plasmodium malariae]
MTHRFNKMNSMIKGFLLYCTLLFSYSFFVRFCNIINCINVGKDYFTDLLKIGIFDNSTRKIKKEIYENINKTHNTYSACKTCIKLVQLLTRIIKKKKETYVDIAIEDTLELNLCNSELWKKYFNYDELLYNEYAIEHCEYTLRIIKDSIELHIYQLYKNEELFYVKVCTNIHHICKMAINEEKTRLSSYTKVKFIYELYSKYLTEEEGFSTTTKGLPYKIIDASSKDNSKLKKSNYALIQSEIKIMHQNYSYNNFKNNNFRLIKINKLEDKVMELFLMMREKDVFIFLFTNDHSGEGRSPNDSILEIKIKIHKASDYMDDVVKGTYKNTLINDDNFLLYKYSCSQTRKC